MAGFLSRATERSCPECNAHVPSTSRFCPECHRLVRGGPSKARAAAAITTAVVMPFAIIVIVSIEAFVAFFGLLGCVVVMALAWWLDKSHPAHLDTISVLVLVVEAVFIAYVIACSAMVG